MTQKNYKWFVVGLLWFVCFLYYADRQAVFTLFPLLRVEFHLSDMQLGLLGSSFMWMYAAFGLVAGWPGDRFSRKGLILAGLLFWICISAATVFSRSYWQLTVLRAFGGISEAFYFPATMSIISSYHGPDTRSRAMSLLQSAIYVGTVGGGSLASILGKHFGWRLNFAFFGGLGLFVLLFLQTLLREPKREFYVRQQDSGKLNWAGNSLRGALTDVLASPLALRLIVAFIGTNSVAMIFMVWLPSFLFRKFHMSLFMAGTSATIYLQAASVVGVICGGTLADRLARHDYGGRMRTQAFGVLAGVPFLLLIGWTVSVKVLIIGMIGFGFCKGIYDSNTWASLHDVVRPEHRATAVGVMNSLGWFGSGIAAVAIAAASQRFGMGLCLSATSLIYVVVAAILLWNASMTVRAHSVHAV